MVEDLISGKYFKKGDFMLMTDEEKWDCFNRETSPEFKRIHLQRILKNTDNSNELLRIYRISKLFGCQCETEALEKALENSHVTYQFEEILKVADKGSEIWRLANQKILELEMESLR